MVTFGGVYRALVINGSPAGGGITTAAGATRYVAFTGALNNTTIEANAQSLVRATVTGSNLMARTTANTLTAASTISSRKNTGAGSQSVSISNGATGFFQDTANTDSFVTGDLANYSIAAGGATGSMDVSLIGMTLDSKSSESTIRGSDTTIALGAGLTRYAVLNGDIDTFTATETSTQWTTRQAYTLSNLQAYVSANSLTTASTIRTRKNTGNGAQSVSVSNGATGSFEDVSGADNLVSGDITNFQVISGGSGADTITIRHIQVKVADASKANFPLMAAESSTAVAQAPSTTFTTIDGGGSITATEANAQAQASVNLQLRNLFVNISANTLTAASTINTRINGANGNLTVSISNGATGTFEDTTNNDSVITSNSIDFRTRAGGATGSYTIQIIAVQGTVLLANPTDGVRVFDGPVKKVIYNILTSATVRIADTTRRTTTKVLRDVLRIRDFVTRAFPRAFTDALRIRDYEKLQTSKVITNIVRINDFVRTTPKAIIRMFEKVRVNDYLSKRTITRTFTDMVMVTDRTAKTVTKVLLDIVRIVDRATTTLVSGVKQILVTDTLRIVDFVAKQTTKLLIDPVRIRDYLANRQITKVFADAVRIFDNEVKKAISNIIRTDAVRIADRTAKTVTKRFLDIVRITDAATFVKSLVRSFTDAIRVVDRTTKTTTKQLRDAIRIRERFSRVMAFTRMFTDAIRITDRVSKNVTKVLTHIIRIADTARATRTMFVVVSDMVRVTDSIAKTITKRLADAVRIRDTITTFREVILTLVDAMRIQDFTTKTITKRLLDILRIVDQASASFVGGHIFTVIVSEAVRVIGVPIGSIVTIIHQGAAAVVEAAKSIGHALENALHPSSKRKASLGEADS